MAEKPVRRSPSPKQLELLRLLVRFQREHGYTPSLQELADQLGLTKVTVYQHVRALEKKGLVTRLRYKARSLQVAGDHELFADLGSTKLRLLGTIAAGSPIDVYENPADLSFEEFFADPERIYALKVRGTSMIDDHIRDGDYVIVEPRQEPRQGETVVARLGSGEVTLKRFYKERDRVRLQPANPDIKPIYARDVEVLGVVIGLMRKY